MGGGFAGGGGSNDTSDDDEEETQANADVTEYGDSDSESDEDDDDSSGVAAAAAAGATASLAASGANASGGVAAGGAGVAGSGGSGGENKDDTDESGETECEPNSEEAVAQEPAEPESPEDSEDTDQVECETGEPDNPDDLESPSEDEGGSEEAEEDDDTEDNDDEDPEEKEASITVYTDPWDNTGWGMEPVLKHLQHTFGDRLELTYEPAPIRRFDEPDVRAERWQENAIRHGMPTNDTVWESDAPSSTEDSVRAFRAAKEQDEQQARDYLRRLRIAAQIEGRNIENRNVLLDLATEAGLDPKQLEDDWDTVEIETSKVSSRLPILDVTIDDVPHSWDGYVEYERALAAFLGQAMTPDPVRQSIHEFVGEHGPVTTEEVMEVFELSRGAAIEELRSTRDIRSEEYGNGLLWESNTR